MTDEMKLRKRASMNSASVCFQSTAWYMTFKIPSSALILIWNLHRMYQSNHFSNCANFINKSSIFFPRGQLFIKPFVFGTNSYLHSCTTEHLLASTHYLRALTHPIYKTTQCRYLCPVWNLMMTISATCSQFCVRCMGGVSMFSLCIVAYVAGIML